MIWGQRRDRIIWVHIIPQLSLERVFHFFKGSLNDPSAHQLFLNTAVIILILKDDDDGNDKHIIKDEVLHLFEVLWQQINWGIVRLFCFPQLSGVSFINPRPKGKKIGLHWPRGSYSCQQTGEETQDQAKLPLLCFLGAQPLHHLQAKWQIIACTCQQTLAVLRERHKSLLLSAMTAVQSADSRH